MDFPRDNQRRSKGRGNDVSVRGQQHLQGHRALRRQRQDPPGGLICNSRLVDNERTLVEEFARKLNTRLIYFLPRDNMVQRAECNRQTVIEFAPDSNQAGEYRRLAQVIDSNTQFSVPTPISAEELEKLLPKYTIL